uniref:Jacalin-type lectin domain-containing protein n=1 Tax=Kalanchoe fedtschenkoi TaxID=63787 RepID=A0A7N0V401_KALFE
MQNLPGYGTDLISVGPWGGQSGAVWNDGLHSGIRQLIIIYGAGIDSIQVEYDVNGTSVWSAKHGGNGGSKTDKVKFNYPEEYLTSIHGHYGSLSDWSPVFVRSLTFGTNKKTYGPFGIEHGTYFSLPTNGIKIVGFHGRNGSYLDAIGAHLRPLQQITHYTTQGNPQTQVVTRTTQSGYSIIQGSLGNQYDVVLALKQKEHAPMQLKELTPRVLTHAQPLALAKKSPEFSSQSSSSSSGESSDSETPRLPRRVPTKVDGPVTYGPWGGTGGSAFEDGMFKGIKHIKFSRNVGLVSIRVLYVDHNGLDVWGDRQGGTGGFIRDKVFFDYPYEILTHITGFYGPAMIKGPVVIKSITFHTTKTKHGPFGEEQGTKFTSNLREGRIVGFHGRKGLYIDAIGVHVLEGKVTPPVRPQTPAVAATMAALAGAGTTSALATAASAVGCNPMVFAGNGNRISAAAPSKKPQAALTDADNKLVLAKQRPPTEAHWGVVKEPVACEAGPWGGDGGRPWDDGVYSGIKQIYLTRDDAINSIQIEYDRNGQSVWSVQHGGNGGRTTHPIKLEYPNEVLTCISGYSSPSCKDGSSKVIRSLTFYTTRGKYGPFGEEVGTFFTSAKTEGKIVGLHGRSGSYLDAIGVHMQHWLGNQKVQSKPIFKIFSG